MEVEGALDQLMDPTRVGVGLVWSGSWELEPLKQALSFVLIEEEPKTFRGGTLLAPRPPSSELHSIAAWRLEQNQRFPLR